jgi:ABC-2 type transport system permease protein
VQTATLQAARDSVLKGKTTAALVLPANFGRDASRAMFSGKKPVVQLLYDPSHNIEMQMLRGLLIQQVVQVVSKSAFSPETARLNFDEQLRGVQSDPNMNPQDKAALKELFGSLEQYYSSTGGRVATSTGGGLSAGLQMPYEMKEEAVTATRSGEQWGGAAHTFCGMAVQGLLFWAIDAGIGILRERQKGLWKRLRAAPLSRSLLLGGKIGSSTLISLFTLLVVFGWGALFFHVRVLGSILGFLAVCVSTALMAATFGLLIATLGRTEQQSRGYAIPAVLAMASLGGVWFPVFLMPQWVQTLSLVIPARWAVDGFDAVTWRGLGLDAALRSSSVLLVFATAFWLIARLRFRWEADG